jgi:hypothetical protein
MDYAGVIKLGLYGAGLCLLLFLLAWIYKKTKEVNYRKGYDAAQKELYDKAVVIVSDINNGTEPFSVQSNDTKWGKVSESGTPVRMEPGATDGNKQ